MSPRLQAVMGLGLLATVLGAALAAVGGLWVAVANSASGSALPAYVDVASSAGQAPNLEQTESPAFNWREHEPLAQRFMNSKAAIVDPVSSASPVDAPQKIAMTLHAIVEKNQVLQALLTINGETLWLKADALIGDEHQLISIYPDYIVTDVPGAEALGLFGAEPPNE